MSEGHGDNPRIMLVEDDAAIRDAFGILLKEFGYQCRGIATGAEAVASVATFEPDLVLMDLGLPDGDGLKFVRQILSNPLGPSPRILALTGRAAPEDREECLAAGCHDVLVKPVPAKQLLAAIEDHLREQGVGS